jgi:hypothetical protein
MSHHDRMRDVRGRLDEQLAGGQAIWYLVDGVRLEVGGILGAEQTLESEDQDGRRQKRMRTLNIQVFDLTVWQDLEAPKPCGQVLVATARGEVPYAIDAVESLSETAAVLRLVRIAHTEMTRPGYRK